MMYKLRENLYYDDNNGIFSNYPSKEYMMGRMLDETLRNTFTLDGIYRTLVDLLIQAEGKLVPSETILQKMKLSKPDLYDVVYEIQNRVKKTFDEDEGPIVNERGRGYRIVYQQAVDPSTGDKYIDSSERHRQKSTIFSRIIIETKGDTLYFSNIPETEVWGLFSIKYEHEDTLPQNRFPNGTWKKVINGETSYCLRDRGEGRHWVFIAFLRERKPNPNYTMQYKYLVDITADNKVIFPIQA